MIQTPAQLVRSYDHLMDEGFPTIGKPDIAHPKLISRSIFRRLDPDLQARILWSNSL